MAATERVSRAAAPYRFLLRSLAAERTEAGDRGLLESYEALGTERAIEIARKNQVLHLVGVRLESVLGPRFPEGWRAELDQNENRVQALVEALGNACATLTRHGASSAVVEAGGVALDSRLSLRAFCPGDMDLLVSAEHLSLAREVLESLGFAEDEKRRGREKLVRTEFVKSTHHGELRIDLCSLLYERLWVPLYFRDRTDEWLDRARPSRQAPAISVLAPSDSLALVTFHTSLHSYVRPPGLRLHVDTDRLVVDTAIDWARYVHEVEAMDVRTRACMSLCLARELLGTPVPGWVIERLAPSSPRLAAIRAILDREGYLADGRPKLQRAKTVLLDALVDDRAFSSWLRSLLLPEQQWLKERFAMARDEPSLAHLHFNRVKAALTSWRPS